MNYVRLKEEEAGAEQEAKQGENVVWLVYNRGWEGQKKDRCKREQEKEIQSFMNSVL